MSRYFWRKVGIISFDTTRSIPVGLMMNIGSGSSSGQKRRNCHCWIIGTLFLPWDFPIKIFTGVSPGSSSLPIYSLPKSTGLYVPDEMPDIKEQIGYQSMEFRATFPEQLKALH